uniref:Ig-like domain-containing protein n=1 Tax=Petromyzon marinus TaxID=7757 RepID=S4RQW6_PETMA
ELSVEEGHEAELTCETSRGDTPVVWLKGKKTLKAGAKYRMVREGRKASLVISSVELGDSDQYTCDSGNFQTSAKLTVTEAGVVFTKPLSDTQVQAEGEVTLSCETSKAGSPVQWYHDDQLLDGSDKRFLVKRDGKAAVLKISCVELIDSGKYVCDSGFEKTSATLNVTELPIEFSKELGELSVEEGHEAELTCETSRGDTPVVWLKGKKTLKAGAKYRMVREGRKASLVISSVELGDSDQYTCDSGNFQTSAKLTVTEAPIHLEEQLQDQEGEELGNITFSCRVSKAGMKVAWRKGTLPLQPGSKYSIGQTGHILKLTVYNLQTGDAGKYECEIGDVLKTSAVLTVREAPGLIREALHDQEVEEFRTATLHCRFSKLAERVTWKKDSSALHPSNKYEMTQEGGMATLLIHNVQLEDAGSYTCETEKDQTSALLIVQEAPVLISEALENQEVEEFETATLSCRFSKPPLRVTWKKGSTVLHPSADHVMKQEHDVATLIIHKVQLDDTGEYTCETGNDRTSAMLLVQEAPVLISEALRDQEVKESGTATLRCRFSKPAARVTWRKDSSVLHPSDKYEMKLEGDLATLVIHNVQLEDSGSYECKTENDQTSAMMTVQEKPLVFTKGLQDLTEEELGDAVFVCEVSKEGAPVTWLKNGGVLYPGAKCEMSQDGRAARLVLHHLGLHDAGHYSCDTGHDVTTATLNVTDGGKTHVLTLNNLTLQDGGCVTFKAGKQTSSATLSIKAVPVKFVKRLEDVDCVEDGEAEFVCEVSQPSAPVTWHRGDKQLSPSQKYVMHRDGAVASLVVTKLQPEDAGPYTCDAGDDATSAKLHVQEAPVLISEALQDKEVEESGTATLRCRFSKPAARVTWRKDSSVLHPSDKYEMKLEGNLATLVIHNVQLQDAGSYECETANDRTCASLIVKEKPVVFTKGLQDLTEEELGDAVFVCEVSKEGAPVTWLKNGGVLYPGAKCEMSQDGRVARLVLHHLGLHDAGHYSCDTGHEVTTATLNVTGDLLYVGTVIQFKCPVNIKKDLSIKEWWLDQSRLYHNEFNEISVDGGKTHVLTLNNLTLQDGGCVTFKAGKQTSSATLSIKAVPVKFVKRLEDVDCVEDGEAEFVCEVSQPSAPVTWHRGDKQLSPSQKYVIHRDGAVASLIVTKLQPEDAGPYTCDAGDEATSANLCVQEAPVLISEAIRDQDVEESGTATLRCRFSKPAARVTWRKDSSVLHPSDKYEMKLEGNLATLVILNVQPEDAGSYNCETENDHTCGMLRVKETPVLISEVLQDQEVEESGTATLRCRFSKPAARVTWRKDSSVLHPSDKYEMKLEGNMAILLIHNVLLEDAGSYECETENDRTFAMLKITEKPVVFTKGLQDLTEEELGDAVFVCEVSKEGAPVTWLKSGGVLYPGAKCEMSQDGRAARLVLHHLGLHDAGQYSCDTGHDVTTATLNVTVNNKHLWNINNYFIILFSATPTDLNILLSRTRHPVEWLLDQSRLYHNEFNEISVDGGKTHVLTLNNLTLQDGGCVTFKAGKQTSSATLSIKAVPVKFVKRLEDVDCVEDGEAEFVCEVSQHSALVTWHRGDKQLSPSQKYVMHRDGAVASLIVTKLQTEDAGPYTCDAGDEATSANLCVQGEIVYLPRIITRIQILLYTILDALFCRVTWRKDSSVLHPSDKYEMKLEGNLATLVIHNVQLEDAGSYECKTENDQTSAVLRVKETPVMITEALHDQEVEENGTATIRCRFSKPVARVTWRKDSSVLHPSDKYEMKLEGNLAMLVIHNVQPEDAGSFDCETENDQTSGILAIKEKPVMFTKGLQDLTEEELGDAVFVCEVSKEGAPVTWLKSGGVLYPGAKCEMSQDGRAARLVLHHLGLHDAGQYSCDTGHDITTATLNVTAVPVKFVKRLEDVDCVEDGEAEFVCEVSQPSAPVTWHRGDKQLSPSQKYVMHRDGAVASLVVTKLQPEDAGAYTCDAGDDATSAKLRVQEAPVLISKALQDQEVEECGTATLRCHFSKPAARVTWRKDSSVLHPSAKYEIKLEGNLATLVIHNVQLEDAGSYECETENDRTSSTLRVQETPVLILEALQNQEAEESGIATLRCRFSKPAASVTWRKDSSVLHPSDKYEMKLQGNVATLVIHNVQSEDAGSYECETENDRTSAMLAIKEKPLVFTKGLQDLTEEELGDAVFVCEVSKEGAPVTWLKNGGVLYPGAKCEMSQDGRAARLVLHHLDLHDAGQYSCDTGDDVTTAKLNVTEVHSRKFERKKNSCQYERTRIHLNILLSRARHVEWWLDQSRLYHNEFNEISVDGGKTHVLTLNNLTLQDGGCVTFKAGKQTSSATLSIKGLPVRFVKTLEDVHCMENGEAQFVCEVSQPSASVTWRKGDQHLSPSQKYVMHRDGATVILVITKLRPEDAGVYICDAGNEATSAKLHIQEAPVLISEALQDQEVEESGTATLRCRFSKPAARVTWRKDSSVLHPSDKYEMKLEGNVATLIIHNVQPDDAGSYECETDDGRTFAVLTLTEKPVVFTKGLQDLTEEELGDAVFVCEVSKEGAPVTWLKNGGVLYPGAKCEMSQDGRAARLVLHHLGLHDAGQYSCDTGHDVTTATLNVTGDVNVVICSTLCAGSEPIMWSLADTPLQNNELNEISVINGKTHVLTINHLTVEESGTVSFSARNATSSAQLTVKRRPVHITQPLQDTEAYASGEVTFLCELSGPSESRWFLGDTPLRNNDLNEISVVNGRTQVLAMKHLTLQDSGTIRFSALNASSSGQLTV